MGILGIVDQVLQEGRRNGVCISQTRGLARLPRHFEPCGPMYTTGPGLQDGGSLCIRSMQGSAQEALILHVTPLHSMESPHLCHAMGWDGVSWHSPIVAMYTAAWA